MSVLAIILLLATDEASSQAASQPAPISGRIAVVVHKNELSERQHDILEALVVREIDKHEGLEAFLQRKISVPEGLCGRGEHCLAKIANALDAAYVVSLDVQRADSAEIVSAKLMALASGEVLEVAQRTAGRAGVLALLGDVISTLFPDLPLRRLASRGVSPAEAERWRPKPLPRWVFLTAVGAAGTSLTLGLVLFAQARDAEARYGTLYDAAKVAYVEGGELDAIAQMNARYSSASTAFLAVAPFFAAAALLTGFWTDFGSDVVLVPLLDAHTAGAGAALRF